MSNRLKRRKTARAKAERQPFTGPPVRTLHVETFAGSFLGTAVGDKGWMLLHNFVMNAGFRPDEAMHISTCPESGKTYVRPYTGEARSMEQEELSRRLKELEKTFKALGGKVIFDDSSAPDWLRLERLQAIIDYELDPPCGCPPTRLPGLA